MILIDDVKYSCIECIRGHRLSLCRHHTRPLLQVRSKGRPTVHANGNPNHRIAVFAQEVQDDCHGCANKKNPVVILKASEKQVLDLESGQILGKYHESNSHVAKRSPPKINDQSFINASLCCSNGVSKINKLCGCNSTKNINKSRILKNYIDKHLSEDQKFKLVQFEKPQVLKSTDGQVFDMVNVPSCSIPGSCCCGEECSCEGCMVHGKQSDTKLFDSLNNGSQFGVPETYKDLVLNMVPQPLVLESQKEHLDDYTEFLQKQVEAAGPKDEVKQEIKSEVKEEPLDDLNLCQCPSDGCGCSNCETHNIINGLKLDEFFDKNYLVDWGDNALAMLALLVKDVPKSCCK